MTARAPRPSSRPASPTAAGARLRVEFLRYLVASAAALAVDLGLFRGAMAVGAPWALAAALGFCAGACVAYGLSVRWVFRERALAPAGEFAVFVAIGVLGLGLTEALLWLAIDRLGLPAMTARVAAAGLVFLFNFSVRRLVLFTRPRPAARRLPA